MNPRQFDFAIEWNQLIKTVRTQPRVIEGMSKTAEHWEELADFKREEMEESDPEQALLEYKLDLVTFEIRKWDLHWQREWTGRRSNSLTPLSLAIAETIFPTLKLEILENGDYEVVTDAQRRLVFDIQNFDVLTAGASLFLAGDSLYTPNDIDLKSASKLRQEQNEQDQNAIALMTKHLNAIKSREAGNVTPLKR